jgi:uncharacterized membrane protein YccC
MEQVFSKRVSKPVRPRGRYVASLVSKTRALLPTGLQELQRNLGRRAVTALDGQLLVALVFALKTFGAALLALYLSFWLGLDDPKWSFLTVFIVSQPDSGLVLAKGFFRMVGTIAGALASMALVLALSQYGELLVASVAVWIGVCNFAARAVRNFTSYGFLLAGYTVAIVGIPAALNPSGAYPLILARFTEISIGIACAALVSRLVLPHDLASNLVALVHKLARRVERIAEAGVCPTPDREQRAAERIQLVKDFAAAEAMRSSAFFESTEARLLNAPLRQVIDAAVHLIAIARGTLAGSSADVRHTQADPLSLASLVTVTADTPRGNAAVVSALVRAENSRALDEALIQLRGSEAALKPGVVASAMSAPVRLWSDPVDAALTGVRSAFAIVITSAFWFATAWPSGPIAVIAAGASCSLIGGMKEQVKVGFALAIVVLLAAVPAFVTIFLLMPLTTDFPSLALALAPLLLTCGFFIGAKLPALLAVTYFSLSANIDNGSMSYDVVAFFNNSLGILIGIGVTIGLFAIFFPESPGRAARRFRDRLFLELCRFGENRHSTLQDYERPFCDHLALLLESVKDERAVGACLAGAFSALSTARAIDSMRFAVSTDRIAPEITAGVSRLFGRIARSRLHPSRASITRIAWEARVLRRRALALARSKIDDTQTDVLGPVIVSCELLRSGLLESRLLLPDAADVR